MALVLQDRVSVNSTGSGTGNLALGSAYPGFRTFASCVPDGSIVYYTIANQAIGYDTEWEVGYGKYNLGTNTLIRNNGNAAETGIYSSSNANAYVNFTAGTNGLQIFITQPSEQAIFQEVNGDVKLIQGAMTISEDGTLGTTLPNTAYQAFTTGDYYMQSNMQNLGSGASASSDWVATADNGSDTEFYVDLGMASSGYNYPDFSAVRPNSAYVISTGSDLRIIAGKYGANVSAANASATDIVFVAGDLLNDGQRARIKGLTGNVILSNTTNPSDTGQKLQVVGTSYFSDNAAFNQFVYSAANTAAGNSTTLATKGYVDTFASGINVHSACNYATTADLGSVTYNNGSSGVGATITNAGTQAALVIDGHTFTATDVTNGVRVLVKNESNAAYNGIYVITNQGSGSTNWVLTRATDYDTGGTGAGAISVGDYTYILSGSTNASTSWVQTTTGTIIVGTTNIVFVQFAAATQYTGTAPINVSGQTISLTGVVPIANGGTNISSYTTGDILYSTGTDVLGKRSIGSTDNVLVVNGGVPTWGQLNLAGANAVSGTLTADHGGTGIATYTLGDIIYSNATNTLAKLPGQTTTTQKFLSQTGDGVNSAAPTWSTVPVGSITGTLPVANGGTGASAASITAFNNITGYTATGATGTTSTNLVFSASPTFTGTITAAAATFSGTLTANGTITLSGSAAGVTGIGTAATTGTFTAGGTSQTGTMTLGRSTVSQQTDIQAGATASGSTKTINLGTGGLAGSTTNIAIGSTTGTSTTTLNGTVNGTVSNATSAVTATNLAGGAAGSIPYQTGAGATSLLATGSGVLVGGATPSYSTAPTLTGTNFSGIPNSATTATAANTASAIVARDASGNFTAGTITATLSGSATSAGTATNATNVAVTEDTATATAIYPTLVGANTGNNPIKTTSTKLTFVPSTGVLSATTFSGSGASLTTLNASNLSSGTIPSGILGNSTVYIGTTAVALNRASASISLTGTNIDGSAGTATTATNATNIAITDDTATASTCYPTWVTTTTGNLPQKVTSTRLSFVPSTGVLTATSFAGSGSSLTNIPTSIVAGTGISVSGATGAVTVTNSGVTSAVAGTGVSVSGATGAVTFSIGQAVATSSNVQFNSLGVGTAGSATAGEIRATNNITAYYVSDRQFKENIQDIPNALDIAVAIGSKTFDWTDAYIEAHGGEDGYFVQKSDFGVIAQDVQAVFPKAVRTKPDGSLAVDYEKLGTLAFAALGELLKRVEALEAK